MTRNVYTVGQVNAYIKNMFTQDYMLNRIYVKGEVSNCKYHTSGHIYFSLKDESGTIACVMFAGQRGGLSFIASAASHSQTAPWPPAGWGLVQAYRKTAGRIGVGTVSPPNASAPPE